MQTYIRELLRALPDAVDTELVAVVQHDAVGELPRGISASPLPVSAGWRRALAGARVHVDGASLIHGLDAVLPLRGRVATVATFHDLLVFDAPWAFSRRRSMGKRLQLRHAARTADAIIAVSSFTADRVRDRFGRESVVIPEAPPSDLAPPSPDAVARVRARHKLPQQFVLHVGAPGPRKDVPSLAAACARVGVPLVVAGASGSGRSERRLRAHWLGYVPQADLPGLYGAATVVGYPSRYEGFGLPPVEAMACGAPVVASRAGPLPEVLGDAAVLVPTGDVDALEDALRDLLADPERRAELRRAGLARAASLSWERTAVLTAGVYRSLVGEV